LSVKDSTEMATLVMGGGGGRGGSGYGGKGGGGWGGSEKKCNLKFKKKK